MNSTASITDYLLLVLLAVIFGSNFMMTTIAVAELPPMVVVTFRLLVATVVLTGIMWASKQQFPTGAIWLPIIACGLFGHTLPFSLLAWGQQTVDAGLAAILMATMPLFTLLLAQIFTSDEKPSRYSVAGFSIALVGIVLLFGLDKLASLGDQSVRQYAITLAAMCYGVNAIITKQLVGMPWQQMTASMMLAGLVLSVPFLVLGGLANIAASPLTWVATTYTGLGPTAAGAILLLIIIRRSGASFLSQINFMVPVVGVALSIMFLGESMPANGYLALALILAGVALARRRPRRSLISINKGG